MKTQTEQCLCQSYYDNNDILQNCTCGKCGKMKTNIMKNLEEYIKKTEKEFDDKFCYSRNEEQIEVYPGAVMQFYATKLRQAGEVAVRDFAKNVLDILDKAETERVFDMPDTTQNWREWKGIRNSITDLLKENKEVINDSRNIY